MRMVLLFCLWLPTLHAGIFYEVAAETGLDFYHFNGMTGSFYIAEPVGSGCAWLDFDRDGDLDVLLIQGNLLGPGKTMSDALFPPRSTPVRDRLYRNELVPSGKVRFTDVTDQSGIVSEGYGMGVAIGDIDRDGWPDIYITNYGSNQLYRNNRDGSFSDVTVSSGSDDPRWSVAATFVDYDHDGWQDLFVTNYILFDFENHKLCPTKMGTDGYCGPSAFPDAPDRLLRNLGNGRFEDVTNSAGVHEVFGSALGVVAADFDGDNWEDLYVANDVDHNILWMNQRNGTFRDDALLAGCAVNASGAPEASMGVDADDFDGDGDLDLFMTHLSGETHTLYINDGSGFFEDRSQQVGMGTATKAATGFGTAWFDYDNDGWLDLLVVNGNVFAIEALQRAKDPYPLHQPNQLFRNRGDGTYEEVTDKAGPSFALSEVSRGAAFGDVDNDGDTDVLISNNNGPPRLLINRVGQDRNWIGIHVTEGEPNREVIGAKIEVTRPNAKSLWRRVKQNAGYASSHDTRVIVGLDRSKGPVGVKVIYPGGASESWSDLEINRYWELKRGHGKNAP